MLGTVSSLAFFKVPDPTNLPITGLNWRIMLGSASLPAFFVMAQVRLPLCAVFSDRLILTSLIVLQVYFCPESPVTKPFPLHPPEYCTDLLPLAEVAHRPSSPSLVEKNSS